MAEDRFYFRQLLAGDQFAEDDVMAQQMANFVYLVGDRETKEAVAIDLAYDVDGVLDLLAADGMTLTGALATHFHFDHVGGSYGGHHVAGLAELLARVDVPVHLQAEEVEWVTKTTEVTRDQIVAHSSGDTVSVGEVDITLIHTPGHTPGSQCFLVEGRLVAGDTLFLDGCGRTDLPGSDPEQMYLSLTQRLNQVPDDAVLCPGHNYSFKPTAAMGEVRERNVVFRPQTQEQWLMMFAR